jgi:hypothetical protein
MHRLICLALAGSFVLLLTSCGTSDKNSWKVLREDAYHNQFSYDSSSIEHTPSHTIKVLVSSNGATYLYEIDCKTKKMRIIESSGGTDTRWLDILRDSGDQLVYDEVCLKER